MMASIEKPTRSGVYSIDRGKQGKWLSYYDASKRRFGLCGTSFDEALKLKDTPTPIEITSWSGPLKPPAPTLPAEPVVAAPVQAAAPTPKPKAVKVTKSTKGSHPDGTIFYRADRKKWVAVWAGKQEAARPTKEGCISFLQKKYGFTNPHIIQPNL